MLRNQNATKFMSSFNLRGCPVRVQPWGSKFEVAVQPQLSTRIKLGGGSWSAPSKSRYEGIVKQLRWSIPATSFPRNAVYELDFHFHLIFH